ncbi:MAG: hypothetical protein KA055_02115 [Aliarcobacter sp.]|nr:hypothetical protein [Aliarcobacter sp.]
MNYELISKLTMEENDKLREEVLILRKRNEILRNEVTRLETLLKNMEKEKIYLKEETNSLKDALEFNKDEQQRFTHYS